MLLIRLIAILVLVAADDEGTFLTGFDTGIVLRKASAPIDDYSCPKAKGAHVEKLQMIKGLWPMAESFMKSHGFEDGMGLSDQFYRMIEMMEQLLLHADELTSVFAPDYDGGDFCAGLTFGYSGSHLLYLMA